jgi:dTDP-4-dehydrorhamnose reductase
MRVLVRGASGLVGSNLRHVFVERHDADVLAPGHEELDVTDGRAVISFVRATRPDAIVHAAIWNDLNGLLSDRRRAWTAYVGATRNVVDAANAVDAQALMAGQRFTVWEGPGLNMLATPTLATDAGELIWRALDLGATGVLHCCGGEHTDRLSLARRAVEAFELDADLLEVGPPPADAVPAGVPYDTRLDATATASALGAELPDLDTMLARFREQLHEHSGSAA